MHALPASVATLAAAQDGVVSRRQVLGLGFGDGDIRVWRGRRLPTTVHDGVYADHTGELTWCQQAWAAVLSVWPAVLAAESSLVADGMRRSVRSEGPILVAVDGARRVDPPDGVIAIRVTGLERRGRWRLSPPRDRLEEAALDVASAASSEMGAVAVLAEAVSSRRTTAPRLRSALDARRRISRRRFLTSVLADLEAGACSVLERAYLRDVERAHGLPAASRQVRESLRGTVYRDVDYVEFGVLVELDGRADHTAFADRDGDLDRDLDAVVTGRVTARLGWGQVLGRACLTAARIARLLQRHGWTGERRRCPRCP